MPPESVPAAKPRRKISLMRVLYLLIGVYGALVFAVYLYGDRLVFFPEAATGGDWTLPKGAEDVWITPAGGPRLHAWYLKHPKAKHTIMVFHGNAGNIAGRRKIYEALRDLRVNVLAVDYRGYGKSQGSPTEEGIYADGLAAWEYLVRERKTAPRQIVVLGQSLGSAVATYVAANRECGGVILEAPMTSVKRMAARVLPFPPLGWALRVDMNNLERIGRASCPLLVVHGTTDSVIPFRQGKEVFEAAKEPKRFVALRGGDHNDLWEGRTDDYMDAIKKFLLELDR
jgi:uncharacterized protein